MNHIYYTLNVLKQQKECLMNHRWKINDKKHIETERTLFGKMSNLGIVKTYR